MYWPNKQTRSKGVQPPRTWQAAWEALGFGVGGHRETHLYVQPLSAELLPIIWVSISLGAGNGIEQDRHFLPSCSYLVGEEKQI